MTTKERRHMDAVSSLGCQICLLLGEEATKAPIHHVRFIDGLIQRRDHFKTIGLCPVHHQNHGLGVSVHDGRESWEKAFGVTEQELLEQVNELMGEV